MNDRADLLTGRSSEVKTLSIFTVISSLGSRLTMFACTNSQNFPTLLGVPTAYISGQQGVESESSSLPLIACTQHNQNVFDADH